MAGDLRRHVRVGGWCEACGGIGRSAFDHWDMPAELMQLGGKTERIVTEALRLIAKHVHTLAAARLGELDRLSGCEAGAARAYEAGRLQVVEHDMWEAVGLPAPEGEW